MNDTNSPRQENDNDWRCKKKKSQSYKLRCLLHSGSVYFLD